MGGEYVKMKKWDVRVFCGDLFCNIVVVSPWKPLGPLNWEREHSGKKASP